MEKKEKDNALLFTPRSSQRHFAIPILSDKGIGRLKISYEGEESDRVVETIIQKAEEYHRQNIKPVYLFLSFEAYTHLLAFLMVHNGGFHGRCIEEPKLSDR